MQVSDVKGNLQRKKQLTSQLTAHYLGHVVVVQGQIGELVLHGELHFVVVMTVLCHGCDSYAV